MNMTLIAALFLVALVNIPLSVYQGLSSVTDKSEFWWAMSLWTCGTVAVVTGIWMALYIFGVRIVIS